MDKSIVVLSGGSTREPRPIVRSEKSWLRSITRETHVFCLQSDERYAIMGSPTHSLWAYAHFRAKQKNQPCIGISRFNSQAFESIASEKPTCIYSLPQITELFLKVMKRRRQVVPSVRHLLLGGAAVPSNFSWENQKQVFPNAKVWVFYGTAETSFIGYAEPGSSYKLFPDVAINIDKDGQLWVKSPMTIDPDQWINTGDLAIWDKKELQIIGRSQRQVEVRDQKIPVEPVEMFLGRLFNNLKFAIVQNARSRLVCISLPSKKGRVNQDSPYQDISLKELNRAIKTRFANFPDIQGVHCLSSSQWPTSESGKTDWRALSALADTLNL